VVKRKNTSHNIRSNIQSTAIFFRTLQWSIRTILTWKIIQYCQRINPSHTSSQTQEIWKRGWCNKFSIKMYSMVQIDYKNVTLLRTSHLICYWWPPVYWKRKWKFKLYLLQTYRYSFQQLYSTINIPQTDKTTLNYEESRNSQ
jgi:hypothetical protein